MSVHTWLCTDSRKMDATSTPSTTPTPVKSTSAPIETPVKSTTPAETVVESTTTNYELWSVSSSIFVLLIIVGLIYSIVFGFNAIFDLDQIKKDWANHRCRPLIMPFAGFFGQNSKENFEFCMGKVFTTYSTPFLGSISSSFGQFTSLLESMFNSVNSLRNIIATLGGGVNVVFQEFSERISNFFFELRLRAIRLKALFGKLYAVLFSVMYMGMSGITGLTSFTNTFLFSFLDAFCFPGETELLVKQPNGHRRVPIKDVKIGDVLLPGNTTVTATFRFYSKGQPMVKLGNVTVSTNHYIMHRGKPIMAEEHPCAVPLGPWNSDELLYCLNTTDHTIPIDCLTFLDYDEAPECDAATLKWIESKINAKESVGKSYSYRDACFAINDAAKIRTKRGLVAAQDIQIGEKLTTGSEVVGIIRREVDEICRLPNGVSVTPATLYWDAAATKWKRMGEEHHYDTVHDEFLSFIVVPQSQIELEDGTHVRDYMEVCSPDSELYYSQHLESLRS